MENLRLNLSRGGALAGLRFASYISNPKSGVSNWTSHPVPTGAHNVPLQESNRIFRISDLRCRNRSISKFSLLLLCALLLSPMQSRGSIQPEAWDSQIKLREALDINPDPHV